MCQLSLEKEWMDIAEEMQSIKGQLFNGILVSEAITRTVGGFDRYNEKGQLERPCLDTIAELQACSCFSFIPLEKVIEVHFQPDGLGHQVARIKYRGTSRSVSFTFTPTSKSNLPVRALWSVSIGGYFFGAGSSDLNLAMTGVRVQESFCLWRMEMEWRELRYQLPVMEQMESKWKCSLKSFANQ